MSAVLRLLQNVINLELSTTDGDQIEWLFTQNLSAQKTDFFRNLLKDVIALTLQYNALCIHLAHEFQSNPDSDEFTEQLAAALMLAELLAHLYRYYLDVPREVYRLQKDQDVYRRLLEDRRYHFNLISRDHAIKPDIVTQKLRNNTTWFNPFRLLFIRGFRVLRTLVPVLHSLEQYGKLIAGLEQVVNPALAYFGWIFFMPRLFSNLFILFKHLIPGWWMTEQEKELGVLFRLMAYLQRHYFQLANDIVWFTAGILSCFVFLGPLGAVGAYFTFACYGFDIILAGIRAGVEIHRLKRMRAHYEQQANELAEGEGKEAMLAELNRYLKILDQQIEFEKKNVLLTVGTTIGIFCTFSLTLPFLAFNPVIPLIGAILFFGVTAASYFVSLYIESLRPVGRLELPPEKTKAYFSSSMLLFKPVLDSEPRKENMTDTFEGSLVFI